MRLFFVRLFILVALGIGCVSASRILVAQEKDRRRASDATETSEFLNSDEIKRENYDRRETSASPSKSASRPSTSKGKQKSSSQRYDPHVHPAGAFHEDASPRRDEPNALLKHKNVAGEQSDVPSKEDNVRKAEKHESPPKATPRRLSVPEKNGDSPSAIEAKAEKKKLILLPPRKKNGENSFRLNPSNLNNSLFSMFGSLAIVLAIFFLLVWFWKRSGGKQMAFLPKEALEVLGRSALPGKQNLYLLRCGNKLLLVSVFPSGAETLTEITDPLEIDRLTGICQAATSQSSSVAFSQVLRDMGKEPPASGFLDQTKSSFRTGTSKVSARTNPFAKVEDNDV